MAVGLCVMLCFAGAANADEIDPGPLYREALSRHGLSTGLDDLHAYLRQLHPRHPLQRKVAGLIDQLGAASFPERREAMYALAEYPEFAQVQLAAAESHPDEEIRRRAGTLRKKQRSEGDFVLFSALRCLKLRGSHESVAVLLPLLPTIRDDYLVHEARDALLACASLDNQDELLAAFQRSDAVEIREAALLALGRIDAPPARQTLERSLQLADDRLALAAAEGLAWCEPQTSLATFARLLSSPDFRVRHRAAAALQSISGQQIGYAPYADDGHRQASARLWKDWVRLESADARLVPLRLRPETNGRILLCLFRPFTVAEIDEAGNDVFRSSLTRAACGGETCPRSGHRYFADWERKSILVLDAFGQIVREYELPGIPNSLHLLPNGHMLTGIYNKNSLCELSPDGEVVWEAGLDGQPSDARRLPNGNTLVALNNRHRVVEINPAGEVAWSIESVRSPESARRLDNGNTLVACGRDGRVNEYSPGGELVWSIEEIPMAYDALLMDNGHLLIAYQSGLREIDRRGNVIRELNVGVVRRMHRY